jgi:hypothetical protein
VEGAYGFSRVAFEQLLVELLIPQFCSDPDRHLEVSGYRGSRQQLGEEDARYFLLAWHSGLIEHQDRGIYRAARSATTEQFFWEGPRAAEPRAFSLWLEPLITIGGLARLHFDHQWPAHLIGTQSIDSAFDIVAFLPDSSSEFIAGEVKKTVKEVDELVRLMEMFGREPASPEPSSGKPRNAFKKLTALRSRKVPVFWALGPNGYGNVYDVSYEQNGVVNLGRVPNSFLNWQV